MSYTLEALTVLNQEVMERISNLDLDPIKYKLMHSDEGEGWTREKVDGVEEQYKRFLYLSITEGSTSIVPTKDIDHFWHQHILDTHKYAEDCKEAFGFFLHHFPYLGMRGKEDAKVLQSSFQHTKARYEEIFGGNYGSGSSDCENCGNCTQSCGVGERYPSVRSQVRPGLTS